MSNARKFALLLAMGAALSAGHESIQQAQRPQRKPMKKPLPNGVHEFHFSQSGEVFAENVSMDDVAAGVALSVGIAPPCAPMQCYQILQLIDFQPFSFLSKNNLIICQK